MLLWLSFCVLSLLHFLHLWMLFQLFTTFFFLESSFLCIFEKSHSVRFFYKYISICFHREWHVTDLGLWSQMIIFDVLLTTFESCIFFWGSSSKNWLKPSLKPDHNNQVKLVEMLDAPCSFSLLITYIKRSERIFFTLTYVF